MAVRKSQNNSGQQPVDKALGLLAACVMVVGGGWIGLRPETILLRALVVGSVTTVLARVAMQVLNSVRRAEDD